MRTSVAMAVIRQARPLSSAAKLSWSRSRKKSVCQDRARRLHHTPINLGRQQIMSDRPQPLSLLDAIMQAIAPPRRPEPRVAASDHHRPAPTAAEPRPEPTIVDRRDESGVKHRGDFPNPSSGAYKG